MQTGQLIMPTGSADRVALVLLASACAKGRLVYFGKACCISWWLCNSILCQPHSVRHWAGAYSCEVWLLCALLAGEMSQ